MGMNHSVRCIGISVQHLSKKFCIDIKKNMRYGLANILKCSIGLRPDTSYLKQGEFWALRDINLDFKMGQVCGIIGPNGSGKSTFLKLLAGIYPPDKGSAVIYGRVGSLIVSGVGFHPYLTVKENVYINAAIYGMSKDEINEKFAQIIKFSGIEPFVNTPVGFLSSGMYARLSFSFVLFMNVDIILADEVLHVSDQAFRKKCIEEIIKKSEREIILVVSHDMEIIKTICNTVIVLNKGKVQYRGENVNEAINYYKSTKL